jgi:uncharacterized membrane protein YuzA (DUF378 family)
MSRRSFLRGGLYHLSLLIITFSAFNWGFLRLTGVDIIGRIFAGVQVPTPATAIVLCVAAVLVLWNNWVD